MAFTLNNLYEKSIESSSRESVITKLDDANKNETISQIIHHFGSMSTLDFLLNYLKSIRVLLIPLVFFLIMFTGMSQGQDILVGFLEKGIYGFIFQILIILGFLMLLLALYFWAMPKEYSYKFLEKHPESSGNDTNIVLRILKDIVDYFRNFHKNIKLKSYELSTPLLIDSINTYGQDYKISIEKINRTNRLLRLTRILHRFTGMQVFLFFFMIGFANYNIYYDSNDSFINFLLNNRWFSFILLEGVFFGFTYLTNPLREKYWGIKIREDVLFGVIALICLIISAIYYYLNTELAPRLWLVLLLSINGIIIFLGILKFYERKNNRTLINHTNNPLTHFNPLQLYIRYAGFIVTFFFFIGNLIPLDWIINNLVTLSALDHLHILFIACIFYLIVIHFIFKNKIWPSLLFGFIIISVALFKEEQRNYHTIVRNRSVNLKLDSFNSKFHTWLNQRKEILPDSGKTVPLFIVLGQGGGSRAALWTYEVMKKLDSLSNQTFSKHTLMLTGASGSLYGFGIYLTERYAQSKNLLKENKTKLEDVFKEDYLSLPLFHYLGRDIWVGGFPIISGVIKKGRGYSSLKLWEHRIGHYFNQADKNPFAEECISFLQQKDFAMPFYVIPTTRVDDGMPLYITDFTFETKIDSLNIAAPLIKIDTSMSFGQAIQNGSRFPMVNPAGYIPYNGHVVDAGYFDNYGFFLAEQFIHRLNKIILDSFPNKFRLYTIIISNDSSRDTVEKYQSQLVAPLTTILNVRSAYNYTTKNTFMNDTQIMGVEKSFEIVLPWINEPEDSSKPLVLPLAWELSERSSSEIIKKIKSVYPKLQEICNLLSTQ
ncbi:MAG: hypothetical protein M3Q56_12450 [Bacteroidota bacterium]|nr:hypothetical protein [Bacteroidota bacterium]